MATLPAPDSQPEARRYSVFTLVILGILFVVLSLPEAFEQTYSAVAYRIGGVVLLPIDVVMMLILAVAAYYTIRSRSLVKSRFFWPLLLLAVLVGIQSIRGAMLYELRDVVRDSRAVLDWLVVLALPQFQSTRGAKKYWSHWGYLLSVVPPVLVLGYTLVMYLTAGYVLSFSSFTPDRMMFVNGETSMFLAFTGAGFILADGIWKRRIFLFLFFVSNILFDIEFVLSKSRSLMLSLGLVLGCLVWVSIHYRAALRFIAAAATAGILALVVTGSLFPAPSQLAVGRFMKYFSASELTRFVDDFEKPANQVGPHDGRASSSPAPSTSPQEPAKTPEPAMTPEPAKTPASATQAVPPPQDLLRFTLMVQELREFFKHPVLGTAPGKPYYYPKGYFHEGQKLSSTSDSLVIEMGAKFGIFGWLLLGWLFVIYTKILFRLIRRPRLSLTQRSFVLAHLVSIPNLLFSSVFGNLLWNYRAAPLSMAVAIVSLEMMLTDTDDATETEVAA